MKKEKIDLKKLTLDTKTPLGSPNGVKMAFGFTLIITIALEIQLIPRAMKSLSTNNVTTDYLILPLLLNIIPFIYPLGKWINWHISNHKIYNILMQIVRSEKLIDYSENKQDRDIFNQRKVIAGVKIVYEETYDGIYLTFYPRGIRNNDGARMLSRRLEELFNLSVIGVNNQLTYTTYLLRDVEKQNYEVSNNDF